MERKENLDLSAIVSFPSCLLFLNATHSHKSSPASHELYLAIRASRLQINLAYVDGWDLALSPVIKSFVMISDEYHT
jgi:hypothetical protein